MKPPISDPLELPASADPTRRYFAFHLVRTAFATLPLALAGTLAVALMVPARSGDYKFTALFIAPCAIIVFGMLQVLVFSVWTAKSYLKAPNLWGVSREVEWSQISQARSLWLIWPCLVISTHKKRNIIWIPLLLRDMKGFARAVEEWAPDDNPLRLWLKQRGF